jgi:8-oxo-dGTP diphosphatase
MPLSVREPELADWRGCFVADRYGSVVDVYVLMRRPDGRILLLERANTGYADGQLCPPSGHLDAGESVVAGAVREAREETGVLIDPGDLAFQHVVHHRNPEGQARIGFFFTTTRWRGEPVNREPHKCAGLHWADPARPPASTVPYTAAALAQIGQGAPFSLDGWPQP